MIIFDYLLSIFSDNQNDNVESFIYKLVDGYFIPFQNFEVEGTAVEFLPIFVNIK